MRKFDARWWLKVPQFDEDTRLIINEVPATGLTVRIVNRWDQLTEQEQRSHVDAEIFWRRRFWLRDVDCGAVG